MHHLKISHKRKPLSRRNQTQIYSFVLFNLFVVAIIILSIYHNCILRVLKRDSKSSSSNNNLEALSPFTIAEKSSSKQNQVSSSISKSTLKEESPFTSTQKSLSKEDSSLIGIERPTSPHYGFWDVGGIGNASTGERVHHRWFGPANVTFDIAQANEDDFLTLTTHPSCGCEIQECMRVYKEYAYYIRARNADCVYVLNCHTPLLQHVESNFLGKVEPALSGFERAKRFNQCKSSTITHLHSNFHTDSVISLKHKFIYVDNVKAGSTTIRQKLEHVFGIGFDVNEGKNGQLFNDSCIKHFRHRITSRCITSEQAADFTVFSFVRDPVRKYESGVRQAWAVNIPKGIRHFDANEIFYRQIKQKHRKRGWMNEHFQTSIHRLMTKTMDGNFLKYDFIGKLENFDEDWKELVQILQVSEEDRTALLQHDKGCNSRRVFQKDSRATLSKTATLDMCNSEFFAGEWDCFDYPRPEVCQK